MSTETPSQTLTQLLAEAEAAGGELEWLEFKSDNADPNSVGEYISALANSAALHRKPRGYLVWGIENGTLAVVGTSFRPRRQKGKGSEDLEPWLQRLLEPHVQFDFREFSRGDKPIVLLEIHPAPSRPVAFSGVEYIRVGSYTKPLRKQPEKERLLWAILSREFDWSAQPCPNAAISDLDPAALIAARLRYKIKNPHLATEVDGWSDDTFLNKAKLCISSRVTNTAVVLLGRPEAEGLLTPAVARISWVLKNSANVELDYQHFGPPLLLAVDRVFEKVRNLTTVTCRMRLSFPLRCLSTTRG